MYVNTDNVILVGYERNKTGHISMIINRVGNLLLFVDADNGTKTHSN